VKGNKESFGIFHSIPFSPQNLKNYSNIPQTATLTTYSM
jgi:hypothetical protein